jgi:hypothetical protein
MNKEPLERLHQSIVKDVKTIVKEAVDEIKTDCKQKKKK